MFVCVLNAKMTLLLTYWYYTIVFLILKIVFKFIQYLCIGENIIFVDKYEIVAGVLSWFSLYVHKFKNSDTNDAEQNCICAIWTEHEFHYDMK